MADYYPLLSRALDALPDRSPAMRRAVYDRARSALIGQLRSLEPPLSDADIEIESKALEAAIERLETDHAAPPPPSNDPDPAPIAEATPPPPALPPKPAPLPEPVLPPAPPPELGVPTTDERTAIPEPMPPVESPAVVPFRAPKPAPAPETPAAAGAVDENPAGTDDPSALPADAASGRQRPRIEVVPPRGGRSRTLRNVFVGAVLLIVIGLIATAAYMLRDKPSDLQPGTSGTQDAPAESGETKYADRIGGDPKPAERPPSAAPQPPPAQPEIAVSQRAILYEENTNGGNNAPATTQGRVVWRLEAVPGEQGQPLETAIRGTIDMPDAGLSLAMTIRRNLDATLPASHTIELIFTQGPAGAARAVQDIGLIQAKEEENARGSPVSGLPVRVRENVFLIGLSSLTNDVERNTDLLLNRNWFDLALKYTSGPRAIVSFEKGSSGTQVMQRAFEQWR